METNNINTNTNSRDTPLEVNPSNGIGHTKYICNTKTRVCGPSNGVLIGTYTLITVPSIIYAITM